MAPAPLPPSPYVSRATPVASSKRRACTLHAGQSRSARESWGTRWPCPTCYTENLSHPHGRPNFIAGPQRRCEAVRWPCDGRAMGLAEEPRARSSFPGSGPCIPVLACYRCSPVALPGVHHGGSAGVAQSRARTRPAARSATVFTFACADQPVPAAEHRRRQPRRSRVAGACVQERLLIDCGSHTSMSLEVTKREVLAEAHDAQQPRPSAASTIRALCLGLRFFHERPWLGGCICWAAPAPQPFDDVAFGAKCRIAVPGAKRAAGRDQHQANTHVGQCSPWT